MFVGFTGVLKDWTDSMSNPYFLKAGISNFHKKSVN